MLKASFAIYSQLEKDESVTILSPKNQKIGRGVKRRAGNEGDGPE
jgi:hypothetical protein